MKNRYLVFEYDAYYPTGGMDDLKARRDSEAEARAELLRLLEANRIPVPWGNTRSGGGMIYDRQEDSVLDARWDHVARVWTLDGAEWVSHEAEALS